MEGTQLEEMLVDRGRVQDGRARSNRQNLPANAVRGAVSASRCGKVVGHAAGRRKARTGLRTALAREIQDGLEVMK